MLPPHIKLQKLLKLNEAELLTALKQLVPDLTKTKGKYDRTDATSAKYDLVVELKCRTDQNWDSVIIEEDKYRALLAAPQKNKRFIILTPVNVYSWDLATLPTPQFIMHNVPTDRYKSSWTEKSVAFIKYADAINIRTKLGL